MPDYSLEHRAIARGSTVIAGIDEVGRGPLAGPVTAAAVILDMNNIPHGLDDSKKLTPRKRQALFDLICASAVVGIGSASVGEIDRLNILRASHLAMERAVAALRPRPDWLLVDGNIIPAEFGSRAEAIIGGDGKSVSIAAASIVAKVTRDALLVDLAQQYPGYGWEKNMGYPTPQHRKALLDLGVTPHHRRSFAPIRNILWQGKL